MIYIYFQMNNIIKSPIKQNTIYENYSKTSFKKIIK